ncbi:type IV toxin-antitoxin system AbiEi family antitoxin (plasmid) [Pseudarthrobacter sp. P1]|uniref:type IV toxin-antitoxin system AbiEi family antitoxin n=1 Tax=Pseudarthrobacter sp. P1 TaxID=3418418 RepID=UPI003CEA3078
MLEDRLHIVVQHLAQYGIDARVGESDWSHPAFEHPLLTLQREAERQTFMILDHALTQPVLPSGDQAKPLIVQDYIDEKQARDYRARNLNFVDEAGNAFIAFGNVYVDVRGRRLSRRIPGRKDARTGASAPGVNLFSAGRSRLLFVLLTWPYVPRLTIREISTLSGVSVGLAQETLKVLQREEYLSLGPGPQLLRQRALFEQWVMTYPHQLAPRLALESFRSSTPGLHGPLVPGMEVSGESALPDLLKPSTLTVYVDEFTPRMAVENKWRRDEHPNVFLRHKFWTDPGSLDIEATIPAGTLPTVPSTLVYADLLASGEPRQREAASILKEHDDRLLRIFRS